MKNSYFVIMFVMLFVGVIHGQNSIFIENQNQGTENWKILNPALNREIEGYAAKTSINQGESLDFYVNTNSSSYDIEVFRMGWYDGLGGKEVFSASNINGVSQVVPTPDPTTGMVECNWVQPYTINTSSNWITGVYLIKLIENNTNKESYVIFVVRNDTNPADIFFQLPVTTYQAYNFWGGKSIYSWGSGNSLPWGSSSGVPAVKVSFNRPYAGSGNVAAGYGIGAGEFLTNIQPVSSGYDTSSAGWDYNMLRWLERNGYSVTYGTNIDTHRSPNIMINKNTFLSMGHDEYWTWEMRDNIESKRDSGKNLIFNGANVSYWQIRFEPSSGGSPNRTMVCYKTAVDPILNDGNSSNDYLSTELYKSQTVGRPEGGMVGVSYYGDPVDGDIVVTNPSHFVFENTDVSSGSEFKGLLGYEVDRIDANSPNNIIELTASAAAGSTSHMAYYSVPGGGQVFATGSMQWVWGLDNYNSPVLRTDRASYWASQVMQNVFEEFGANRNLPIENTYSGSCVKLVSLAGSNITGKISMAEFDLFDDNGNLIPKTNWLLQYVDSEENSSGIGAANNAFDNDVSTFWSTEDGLPNGPHEIQINLGGTYNISGIRYIPKQGSENGSEVIMDYQFYLSQDCSNWVQLSNSRWNQNDFEKEVFFTDIVNTCQLEGLSCNDNDPLTINDVYDANCGCSGVPIPCGETQYLSDLVWSQTPINGWGPPELDKSNGENGSNDGIGININGVTYTKGIGVHALSEIVYSLNGLYTSFNSDIGMDNEIIGNTQASVQFLVYCDDVLKYQSPVMTPTDDALSIEVDITGINELKLVVNDAGNGINGDHGDWADARVIFNCETSCEVGTSCDDGDPCTENDIYDADCGCSGTLLPDNDGDGVCDDLDQCPGQDDVLIGTACDDNDPLTINDVYDANCGCSGVPKPCGETEYLSDLVWSQTPINGWGPPELDKSNGENGSNDGNVININGVTYSKGLGVHASSEIVYSLNGLYTTFNTDIGMDNEIIGNSQASVQFLVYCDDVLKYQSPVMRPTDDALSIEVDITGINELKLVVDNAGNGINGDHGDWADARVIANCETSCEVGTSCDDGDQCTNNDIYDEDCGCSGTLLPDNDGDGVCDDLDQCPGQDDALIGTACDDNDPLTINDVYDANCGCSGVPIPCGETEYLSDLVWSQTPINGWGPPELDKSNGENGFNDGAIININGVTYSKGLGVHASSEIVYSLSGLYTTFNSDIGVDYEIVASTQASVQFLVYCDDVLKYQSPVMRPTDDALSIEVDVTGVNELKLVVDNAGNGINGDHGDWADARVIANCETSCEVGTSCDDGDPCTNNDIYDEDCGCSGTLLPDNDGDGVCDDLDQCPGQDDALIGTACDDNDPLTINDVYDANCGCSGVSIPCGETEYLSDLVWSQTPINGWGPPELDKSNGENGFNDGAIININGVTYSKGLGVHASSEIVYSLSGLYTTFNSDIGVDYEIVASTQASVQFLVYCDDVLKYQSPVMRPTDDALSIEVDVTGVNELKLVVDDAGNGINGDHGDWADARVIANCNQSSKSSNNNKTLSLKEVDLNNIELYPNPASTKVYVKCHSLNGKEVNISLYNMLGQLVSKTHLEGRYNPLQEIDLVGFSEGFYLINITDLQGGILIRGKLIISNK